MKRMDKVAMLTEILAQNPDDAFARYGLAIEKANNNDIAGALENFDLLIAKHPDYTAGYQMAGQTLAKAGRTEEARERLLGGIESARRTGNSHAAREMQALLDDMELGI
jgi:predicted Zn-dependent protease